MDGRALETVIPCGVMGEVCFLGMRDGAFSAMDSFADGEFALGAARLLRMDGLHCFRTI